MFLLPDPWAIYKELSTDAGGNNPIRSPYKPSYYIGVNVNPSSGMFRSSAFRLQEFRLDFLEALRGLVSSRSNGGTYGNTRRHSTAVRSTLSGAPQNPAYEIQLYVYPRTRKRRVKPLTLRRLQHLEFGVLSGFVGGGIPRPKT